MKQYTMRGHRRIRDSNRPTKQTKYFKSLAYVNIQKIEQIKITLTILNHNNF